SFKPLQLRSPAHTFQLIEGMSCVNENVMWNRPFRQRLRAERGKSGLATKRHKRHKIENGKMRGMRSSRFVPFVLFCGEIVLSERAAHFKARQKNRPGPPASRCPDSS